MTQFQLNAKYLELFFGDGSNVEFHPSLEVGNEESIEIALPWEKRELATWREALAPGRLTEKQIDLLEDMVEEGQAARITRRRNAGLAGRCDRP